MPEEFLIGINFSRDGSDYDPSARTPVLGEVLQLLGREGVRSNTTFILGALGILYPGGNPDGVSFPVTTLDILRVIRDLGGTNSAVNPAMTPFLVRNILNLHTLPEKIYGFVVKLP